MNIHIDQYLSQKLDNHSLSKLKIGSKLYGCDDLNSDDDWLVIYQTSEFELNLPCQINHQFQYKTDDADINYSSIHTFVRNLINGDSTINFELVWSGLSGTTLDFLNQHLSNLVTYQIIKSFLGLAKRDLKHLHKRTTLRDRQKGLHHIFRSNLAANLMIESVKNDTFLAEWDFYTNELKQFWNRIKSVDDSTMIIKLKEDNDNLRKELNSLLDRKKIVRNLDPAILRLITEQLSKIGTNKDKEMPDWADKLCYSYENWVEY